jgi:hypothetical protein
MRFLGGLFSLDGSSPLRRVDQTSAFLIARRGSELVDKEG